MAFTLWSILLIGSTLLTSGADDPSLTPSPQNNTRRRRCHCGTKRVATTRKANVLHRAERFHRKHAGGATDVDINASSNSSLRSTQVQVATCFVLLAGRCELVIGRRRTQPGPNKLQEQLMQDTNPVDGDYESMGRTPRFHHLAAFLVELQMYGCRFHNRHRGGGGNKVKMYKISQHVAFKKK